MVTRLENVTPDRKLSRLVEREGVTEYMLEPDARYAENKAAKKLTLLMRDEVNKTIVEYDVPIAPEKIVCIVVDRYPAYGSACVLECDWYEAGDGRWACGNPTLYGIVMPWSDFDSRSYENQRRTVRHELAHIMGWETEGVTYERKGNHADWMSELDAWA